MKKTEHRIDFEEVGTQIAQEAGLASVEVEQVVDRAMNMAIFRFRSYLAAGAPHTVVVKAQAPATWWDHVKGAVADNAIQHSATRWGENFGHWLSQRVTLEAVYGREDVARNVCPHIHKPSHHRDHLTFVAMEPGDQ